MIAINNIRIILSYLLLLFLLVQVLSALLLLQSSWCSKRSTPSLQSTNNRNHHENICYRSSILSIPLAMAQFDSSKDTQILLTKAIEHHKNGEVPEAIARYQEVIPLLTGTTKSSILGNLGALYMQLGKNQCFSYYCVNIFLLLII